MVAVLCGQTHRGCLAAEPRVHRSFFVSAKDKDCVFLISREVVEDLQCIEGRLRVSVDAPWQGSLVVNNDEPVLGRVIIFLNSAEDLIVDVHEIMIASDQPSPIGVIGRTHKVA